jgi:hypothetical protein
MAEGSKKLIVKRFSDHEEVLIKVAHGQTVQMVLDAIGEGEAMGLATEGRHGLVFLAPATLWNWIEDLQTLRIVQCSYPC